VVLFALFTFQLLFVVRTAYEYVFMCIHV